MLTTVAILFAPADSGGTAAPGGGPGGNANPFNMMLPMIVIFAAFWYFLLHLPMKRERARQAALLASIEKNDRVLTSSGIYGIVTNVSKESNEVTLSSVIDWLVACPAARLIEALL